MGNRLFNLYYIDGMTKAIQQTLDALNLNLQRLIVVAMVFALVYGGFTYIQFAGAFSLDENYGYGYNNDDDDDDDDNGGGGGGGKKIELEEGGGGGSSDDDEPEEEPEPEVLGEQVSSVPVGAPNTGAGGMSTVK